MGHRSRCWVVVSWAPAAVQAERRLVWRTIACPPKDQPRSWLRLLEQGPESQSASSVCWGGVSSVMGSSDLDAHSFVPSGHKVISIKAHCLEGLNDRFLGWRAVQSLEAASWARVDPVVDVPSLLVGFFAALAAREASRCCSWASRNAAEMSRVRSVIDWRSRQKGSKRIAVLSGPSVLADSQE